MGNKFYNLHSVYGTFRTVVASKEEAIKLLYWIFSPSSTITEEYSKDGRWVLIQIYIQINKENEEVLLSFLDKISAVKNTQGAIWYYKRKHLIHSTQYVFSFGFDTRAIDMEQL